MLRVVWEPNCSTRLSTNGDRSTVYSTQTISQGQARSVTGSQAGERWKASHGREQKIYMLDWLHVTKGTCVHRWAGYVNEVGVADRLSVAEAESFKNYWEPDDWTLKLPSSRSAWTPAVLNRPTIRRRLLFTMIITDTLLMTSRETPSWTPTAFASQCSVSTLAWLPRELFLVVSLPFPPQATSLQNSLFVIKKSEFAEANQPV